HIYVPTRIVIGAIVIGPIIRAIAIVFVLQPRDRHHMLAFVDAKQGDALGLAAGDPDVVYRHTDQPPAVGDHHDVMLVFDREGIDHGAVALGRLDIDDALAAAPGDPVFI